MSYSKHLSKNRTHAQNEKAREDQVINNAGGYVFQVDAWNKLDRFLILGTEKGTYYASEKELTVKNYDNLINLVKQDCKRFVNRVVEISDAGRAPKNIPAIVALAVACVHADSKDMKTYANANVDKVCRYSTDFFYWLNMVKELKGGKSSSSRKRVIKKWYENKSVKDVAYQICKYPQRKVENNLWSHRDGLRISRPKASNKIINNLYKYIVHGIGTEKGISEKDFNSVFGKNENLAYIYGHELAKKSKDAKTLIPLIKKYGLTRESIPNELYTVEVWDALIPTMPMTAMIRNLGKMTKDGALKPLSDNVNIIVEKLTNEEVLKKSRIHPMNILMALKTYQSGQGKSISWNAVPQITDALEEAFYKAFNYVEPSGKKVFLGIDVSGSMSSEIASLHISSAEAAAVVALTIAKKEKQNYIFGFSHTFKDLKITAKDNLDSALKKTRDNNFGNTDCSLPMTYALNHKIDVDTFVVLTDCETWCGSIQPFEALKRYRKEMNPNAKLAVLAFTASDFTIADPSDAGMLDIVGLDSNVPEILSQFIKGEI